MILADYELDILANIINRFFIIVGLLIILHFVLLIGIYIECRRTRQTTEENNKLFREIRDKNNP